MKKVMRDLYCICTIMPLQDNFQMENESIKAAEVGAVSSDEMQSLYKRMRDEKLEIRG